MSKLYRVIVGSNCTDLNGTVLRLVKESNNSTSGQREDDPTGAMQFIVATILVYSIFGVFCTLFSKIRRTRGKSHTNTLIDENIGRYLKREKSLKFDGQRHKMMHERGLILKRLRDYEEKQAFFDVERDVSSEHTHGRSPHMSRKKQKKKRRKTKRERRFAEGLGRAELMFLVDKSGADDGEKGEIAEVILEDIPEQNACESLESAGPSDV